jgi:hypothetical protein
MKDHPGWRVWFVPNALDGSVTCHRSGQVTEV